MNKCPLCEIDYPHSHFSYDIAEYVDALRDELELSRKIADEAIKQMDKMTTFAHDLNEGGLKLRAQLDDSNRKLEQRIAMEIDEHLKVVELQAKLDMAMRAMKIVRIRVLETYPITGHTMLGIIDDALAEIERLGMNVQG